MSYAHTQKMSENRAELKTLKKHILLKIKARKFLR